MSRMTNPDNGMMENQQADDLEHEVEQGGAAAVKGASVESPLPRLGEGVDADGLLEEADAMPDKETEAARKAALAKAKAGR
jgi:hypothetical protein